MDGKPGSPRRDAVRGQPADSSYAGSSRASLLSLFRRQPRSQSSRANIRGSFSDTRPNLDNSVSQKDAVSTPSVKSRLGSSGFHAKPTGNGRNALGGGASLSGSLGGDSFLGAFDNLSFGGDNMAEVESPQQAHAAAASHARVLRAAEAYRNSIETMGNAAAEFGAALYEIADTKGSAAARTTLPHQTAATDFQAAGGLHLLIANHANILASSIESQLETPGGAELSTYKQRLAAKEAEFKTALRTKMAGLRQADTQRVRDSRKRPQNLLAYRSSLLDLTSQIDDINRLKFEFLSDLHALSTDLSEAAHRSVASVVNAEIELFENLSRKGWSGGGLDGLLAGCPDPFDAHDDARRGRATSIASAASGDAVVPHTHSDASYPASAKSPNLFSIIPRDSILPAKLDDDTVSTILRRRSDASDIANLTLTPPQARQAMIGEQHADGNGGDVEEPDGEDIPDATLSAKSGRTSASLNGGSNGKSDHEAQSESQRNSNESMNAGSKSRNDPSVAADTSSSSEQDDSNPAKSAPDNLTSKELGYTDDGNNVEGVGDSQDEAGLRSVGL